jgi:hypothetical protein
MRDRSATDAGRTSWFALPAASVKKHVKYFLAESLFPGSTPQSGRTNSRRSIGSVRRLPVSGPVTDGSPLCGWEYGSSPAQTNPFTRNVENHAAAVGLYFMYYNSVRVHQTLRVAPAMGHLFRTLWSILEIVAQLAAAADKKSCIAEALTMFVGWVGVIVFTAAVVAGLRANHLADRIIEEVHARMEPKDRVPSYRVWNWQWYGFLDQHKRLYPASDLRSRTYRWTAA